MLLRILFGGRRNHLPAESNISTIMKCNFWKLTTVAAGVCAVTLAAVAAPLERADVVADPAWLLHLDCDALRPTAVGKYVLSELNKPEAKAKLAVFQALFSFDPRTQLHGVTLYGTGSAPEDGVLMVYADFDPAHLVNLAQAAKGYESHEHGNVTIHSWIDDKKKPKGDVKPRIYAAIEGNRVIFAQREENVAKALDVAEKKEASLAKGRAFPELGRADSGHVVEAAAQKLNLPGSNPNANILKLSKSIQLVMGEKEDLFNGQVTLVADSDEVAGHVFSIVQGLLALAKLQTDKPEAVKLANAVDLKQDGSRIVGSLSLPAADVVAAMKADAARKAALKQDQ